MKLGLRPKATHAVHAAGIAAIIMLSACSIGGTSAPSSSNSTSILQQVIQRGVLRAGIGIGNPPYESLDSGGNYVGYDVDIVRLLAKDMGVNLEIIHLADPASRISTLQTHKADITVGSFNMTLKRAQVIAYSDAINLEYSVLLANTARSDLKTLNDFNQPGIKFAITNGNAVIATITQYFPKATQVIVAGSADETQALVDNKVQGIVLDNIGEIGVKQAYPGVFKEIPGHLGGEIEDGIGLPMGDFEWWWYVNRFVHDINRDGTTYTLGMKWFGEVPGPFSLPPVSTSG